MYEPKEVIAQCNFSSLILSSLRMHEETSVVHETNAGLLDKY